MKAEIIVIIVVLIILATYPQKQTPTITGSTVKELPEELPKEEEIICNPPYIRHANSCCLDKNSNNICDNDETIEKLPEPQAPTIIEDSCTDTTYFECWGSYITKDEIFLRLRAKRDGYNIIKKIEFPSIACEKKFEPIPKEQGLKIREVIEVKIQCKSSTTYFKDLSYNLESIYHPSTGDTTEWLDKTRGIIISSGTLTGTVRDKPPSIL